MATNKSMIEILERTRLLINELEHTKMNELQDVLDELKACGEILDLHIKAQKKQKGTDYNDIYVYNPVSKEYERKYR